MTPVTVVRVENIQGPGTAKSCEISCKTVPEIPQLKEANPAQVIPLITWLLFITNPPFSAIQISYHYRVS